MKTILLFLSLSASSFAGEFAVLTTGFRLHAERHETDGSCVRLYQKDGGFSQLDRSLIAGFEKELEAQPSPAAAPLQKPAAAAVDPHELVEAAAKRNGL